jgi:hypothetical protein
MGVNLPHWAYKTLGPLFSRQHNISFLLTITMILFVRSII